MRWSLGGVVFEEGASNCFMCVRIPLPKYQIVDLESVLLLRVVC